MFEDPFNPYKQPDKLILPAVPTEEYHPPEYLAHAEQRPFQAGGLIRKNPTPVAQSAGPLHKKFTYLWHRDPAYKVLFIAVGVVLVSSIVSIVLLAGFVNQLSPSPDPIASLPAKMQATPTLAPTQQPTAISTPIPTPIPTPTPIIIATPILVATAPTITAPPPNPDGKLTVQINTLPVQINNNVMVPVTVTTNQPGATVSLFVTYSAIPLLYTSDPQTTDARGNTTFSWNVHERTFSPFTRMIAARVTAVVHYHGRPQATSQTVTVHVLTK